MKRPDSATLRRHYGFLNAGNIEKQLNKIDEEFSCVRTEQREVARWIRSLALGDLDIPSRFAEERSGEEVFRS
jgi:hypothetical protein